MHFHAAGDADGRWCIFELWESRDGLERFLREDLARAFEELGGGESRTPQPEVVFEVVFQGP
jgi:quinol monooxygenase YgiN